MRPIPDSRGEPVFGGVDMHAMDVTHEIALVANDVLTIAPLPDAPFALGGLMGIASLHPSYGLFQSQAAPRTSFCILPP
jgi:hypothetical protein